MTALQPARVADPGAGAGRLVLITSRSACSPHLARRPVRVVVEDGHPLEVRWGRTEIDVPAGRHRLRMQVGRRWGWGPVADAVPVPAGASVEVFYRAPALPHLDGALGPVPQATRGLGALVGWAVVVVLLAAALLGGLLAALP